MNKYKEKILIVVISIILFSGCAGGVFGPLPEQLSEDVLGLQPEQLNDERFIGEFNYFDYKASDEFTYETYEFDGTSKVRVYSKYQWWDGSNWHYSGDYVGDYNVFWYEFEILNGEYRERLWDNEFSDWSDWALYEFNSDGTVLTLYSYFLDGDGTYSREYEKE